MTVDPIPVLREVVAAFDILNIRYIVGGSMASMVHGIYRYTNDIDIVADLTIDKLPEFARLLQPDFYVDVDLVQDAIRDQSSFNIIYYPTAFKVDIFIKDKSLFSEIEFGRRRLEEMTGSEETTSAFVASPEDIVLQKLRWYRLGNEVSDRQWNDVLGVLKVQAPTLEYPYMNHWAGELGVADLLARAYDDAGIENF